MYESVVSEKGHRHVGFESVRGTPAEIALDAFIIKMIKARYPKKGNISIRTFFELSRAIWYNSPRVTASYRPKEPDRRWVSVARMPVFWASGDHDLLAIQQAAKGFGPVSREAIGDTADYPFDRVDRGEKKSKRLGVARRLRSIFLGGFAQF